MQINELTLEGFRNYEHAELTFHPRCNVIYGDNAQGKTNLLEAVVYLSCGRSPRAHGDKELLGFTKDTARLCGKIFSRQRDFVTEIRLYSAKASAYRGRSWHKERSMNRRRAAAPSRMR